jgi:hypothetical protein
VAQGQRAAKNRGRPGAKWLRRGQRCRSRVLAWFANRCRNHHSKRAEKPHSKSSRRKTLDGPATRPKTPLAVENSVGKLAAPHARRPMPAREREHGELPSPNLSLFGRKAGWGHFAEWGEGPMVSWSDGNAGTEGLMVRCKPASSLSMNCPLVAQTSCLAYCGHVVCRIADLQPAPRAIIGARGP